MVSDFNNFSFSNGKRRLSSAVLREQRVQVSKHYSTFLPNILELNKLLPAHNMDAKCKSCQTSHSLWRILRL